MTNLKARNTSLILQAIMVAGAIAAVAGTFYVGQYRLEHIEQSQSADRAVVAQIGAAQGQFMAEMREWRKSQEAMAQAITAHMGIASIHQGPSDVRVQIDEAIRPLLLKVTALEVKQDEWTRRWDRIESYLRDAERPR